MVFSSLSFLCAFLPVVLILHAVLPGMRSKNAMLLVASLLFYAYGEPVYVLLMLFSTFFNWVAGLVLGKVRDKARTLTMVLAVCVNLGLLVVFKYADMLIDTVNGIIGASIEPFGLALPVGISFFTFQALSYVVDVYRGDVPPQRNYGAVLLYVSFFPQLIAGPIVKYHDVEEQLACRRASIDDVALGLRRFCVGLAKKVLVADVMAQAVDAWFGLDAATLGGAAAWLAAVAYMMQIYFDFSGYSDMAIGLGRMFGFRFKGNFDYPYCAVTVQDFWHRWHISLSTWFKEYLYIPLGGNRKGQARTMLNKFAVFFLCGLWHGASWTFVLWGVAHGLTLMFERVVPMHKLPRILGHLYTLLFVCLTFVLFRADSLGQALQIIQQMFVGWGPDMSWAVALRQLTPLFLVSFACALVLCWPVLPRVERALMAGGGAKANVALVGSFAGSLALAGLCFLTLASGAYSPFIYFRF